MTFQEMARSYNITVFSPGAWNSDDSEFIRDADQIAPGVFVTEPWEPWETILFITDARAQVPEAVLAVLAMTNAQLAYVQLIPEDVERLLAASSV